MTRTVPEWIGANDDVAIPPRVRVRVAERQDGKCVDCTRSFGPKLPVEIDHKIPLILGGEHRESNLRAVCKACHSIKTKAEVKIKSKVAKAKQDRLGIKTKKHNWNPRKAKFNWKTGRYELTDSGGA